MPAKARAEITLFYVIEVAATYRYYLLQSSTLGKPAKPTTNPPSGNWNDTEPSYTSGSTNSLYYVDLTVYSDGTFAYSNVSLSTSYEAAKEAWNKAQNAQDTADGVITRVTAAETNIEQNKEAIVLRATKTEVTEAINGIKIGGRNLLYNSRLIEPFSGAFPITVEKLIEENIEFYRAKRIEHSIAPGVLAIDHRIPISTFNYSEVVGKTVTISMKTRASHEVNVSFLSQTYDPPNSFSLDNATVIIGTEWKTVIQTVDVFPEILASGGLRFIPYSARFPDSAGENYYFDVREWKLELGNKATDWTPAPEDIRDDLDDAATRLSSAETAIDINSESIKLAATKSELIERLDGYYTKEEADAALEVKADAIEGSISQTREELIEKNGELQREINTITKYFSFDIDGLTIGEADSPYKIAIDNDEIVIKSGETEVQRFDVYGNGIVPKLRVTKSLYALGYLLEKDNNGNVNCGYVGGDE